LSGSGAVRRIAAALLCLLLAPCAWAQKVDFRRALELALQHSTGMGIALADQMRTRQAYLGTRYRYIPQVVFGSGLAQSWGYPMSIEGSAPSVFNIASQSTLLNWAQHDFLRAARFDLDASSSTVQDRRQDTLLETALTYVQLDQAGAQLRSLQQEAQQADRLQTISRERLQAGIDSKLDLTKASLNAARARLRMTQIQGLVDQLRLRLAQLTGLDVRELEIDPPSIPPLPKINPEEDITTRALANSSAVKAADEKVRAAQLRAKGEHKQLYPAVDLVGNYGLFTKYNNLDLLFPQGRFSRNNATFGLAIRFPFLNMPQRSQAVAADAEALKAQKQADAVRQQVANDALRLQRSVQQLSAADEVAQLEYELAEAEVESAQVKMQTGAATVKDQQIARIEASDKQAALFDAQFQLQRAWLQLLRLTGDLQNWALR
jgi:outer membrane protein TolC